MATLKDVAKLAGVSVATASRVLNKNKNVTPDNYQAIMSAVKTLNYTPNYLGRSLRMSSSKKILVLQPTLSNQFYSRVVLGIEDIARANRYNVIIGSTHGDKTAEEYYLKMLFTRLVDGIVLFSTLQSEVRLNEIASAYPIVQCCEYKEGVNASRVIIDNVKAAYEAVCHLIDCGHSDIAIIASGTQNLTSLNRIQGYQQALADHGLPVKQEYILNAGYNPYQAAMECERLMTRPNPPTAVFCISDGMAMGAIRSLASLGYRICDDVAVAGFDNTSITEYFVPSITTVSQPRYRMGQTAMKMLLRKLEDVNSPTEFVTMPHELIIRQSTVKDIPAKLTAPDSPDAENR